MGAQVKRLTNANIYLDGGDKLGRAEEIDLPTITAKMTDHKALGMAFAMELPTGFDKMECRIKWNSIYKDTLAKMGNPYQQVALQCRGSIEDWTSSGRTGQEPYVVFLRGTFKEVPTGNFKQHENVELESRMNVTYVRVEIGGVSVLEADTFANIYKLNGVDVLAQYRQNLGA